MITQHYTSDTPFRVRSWDAKTSLFFDTRANAEAFCNHPANFGRKFSVTFWDMTYAKM